MSALAIAPGYNPIAHGAKCHACPLKGQRVVPPTPAVKTRLVIVGMNPGRMEERLGEGFVGPSGKLLDTLLGEASFPRADAHITNAALCRSDSDDQIVAAIACCAPRLARELEALPPRAPILALGAQAAKVIVGRGSIFKTRGFVWKIPPVTETQMKNARRLVVKRREKRHFDDGEEKLRNALHALWLLEARSKLAGRTAVPSLHPAFLLRGADTWRPVLAVDIDRACRWAKRPFPLEDEGPFVETAKPDVAKRALAQLGGAVTVDIETDGPDPLVAAIECVGVCDVDTLKCVVLYPWGPKLVPVLRAALKRRTCVTHNGPAFDQIALEKRGIVFGGIEDTLIAHHTFASHLRQGLDHVASMYCDASPWKVVAKARGAEEKGLAGFTVTDEDLTKYNCLIGSTFVVLADGSKMRIEEIVRRELSVDVLSLGPNGIEPKRVVGWHRARVQHQSWIRILIEPGGQRSRGIVATPEHRIHTNRGWLEARDVRSGDEVALPERALSSDERCALLGTLLGDSSMAFSPCRRAFRKDASTASVAGGHSESSGLAQAKTKALCFLRLGRCTTKHAGFAGDLFRRYSSKMSSQVAALRPLLYGQSGKKRLSVEALNQLGAVGMAWWFMDDGCLQKQKAYRDGTYRDGVTIATNCFSREDVDAAVVWFRNRFGPTCAGKDRVIRLGARAAKAFGCYIAPFVFPCMRYKLPRGVELPAYIDSPLARAALPLYVRVVQAGAYTPMPPPSASIRNDRALVDTRFCLTVADNHNFFTAGGLVANCADVRLDALSWRRMQPDLKSERHVYEADMALAQLCKRMQIAGVRMDLARRDELSKRLRNRAAALKGEMRTLTRKRSFSPAKLTDIRAALFGRFNAPVLHITPKGMASTGSALLEALRAGDTRASKLADLILRWRSAQKTRSTFLDGVDVLKDGRVHPSWRSFGTVTGRLSCRGPNLQNLVRRVLREVLKKATEERIAELFDEAYELDTRVRECYVAAPGCELVYFDLRQSEMRAAAHISGDENFIATCESGDVHSGNAAILFPDHAEMIKSDPKGKGKKFRDVTKNAGFGILYLAEIVTIFEFLQARGFDVSLNDVEAMFAEIHGVYTRYYQYCEENVEFCRKHGHLRTELLGRIRWFGWFPKPPEVANFKVQSFIGDLMNAKLIALEPRLPHRSRFVMQVHDSAVVETPSRRVEQVRGLIKETWDEPIVIPSSGRKFVMPIDLKVAERLSDFG